MSRDRPQGWNGEVFGGEPVGAVLSVGVKSAAGGYPTDRDRFHIKLPHERDGIRPLHPSFAAFNAAKPDARRRVLANLMHMRIEDAVSFRRMMYRLPKQMTNRFPAPPNRRPQCEGNGRTAVRHLDTGFETIRGCGDLCEFAMNGGPCKPRLEVYFRPQWTREEWPAPLMKFASGSVYCLNSLLTFLDFVAEAATGAGLCPPSKEPGDGFDRLRDHGVPVMGLPFSLLLEERTSRERKTRFPVVEFAAEGDIMRWLDLTQAQIRQIAEGRVELPALPSVRELSDDEVALDSRELQPGLPGVRS